VEDLDLIAPDTSGPCDPQRLEVFLHGLWVLEEVDLGILSRDVGKHLTDATNLRSFWIRSVMLAKAQDDVWPALLF
jgi:hypothetical protein